MTAATERAERISAQPDAGKAIRCFFDADADAFPRVRKPDGRADYGPHGFGCATFRAIREREKFIGDECVVAVESRAQLRELLGGRTSGGVFLTTIHKFTEDTQLLSERANIICISDEAHRSQTNLAQQVKQTGSGVRRSYGFAKYLHDSFPNATRRLHGNAD